VFAPGYFLSYRGQGWLLSGVPGEGHVVTEELIELFAGLFVAGAEDGAGVDGGDDLIGVGGVEDLSVVAHEGEGSTQQGLGG
jgi:hypothetical protein